MKKNKRAMELSINFVIILVMALAVFFGSLVIAKSFFGKSSQLSTQINDQTRREVEALLDDGSPLQVPQQTIYIERGGYANTGIGVYNILGNDANFSVKVDPVTTIPGCDPGAKLTLAAGTGTQKQMIKNTEKHVFSAIFRAEPDINAGCDYMFNVIVRDAIGSEVLPESSPRFQPYTPKIIVKVK